MSHSTTSAVTTPGVDTPASVRSALGRSSRTRTALATIGTAAALTVATAGLSLLGSGQAHADTIGAAKVRAMDAVTASPGAIRTPSGHLRCTKPGQYHVKVAVPVTTKGRSGIRQASLWLQPTFQGDPILIGRAKSRTAKVSVIGCLSPSQIQGLKRSPVYLIASDVLDGHTNIVRVRVAR